MTRLIVFFNSIDDLHSFNLIAFCSLLSLSSWAKKAIAANEGLKKASNSPVKLVANTSGKLKILAKKNYTKVSDDSYIAYIQNSANIEDVRRIQKAIQAINIKNAMSDIELGDFPRNVSLGDLNSRYFTFLDALAKLEQHNKNNIFDKQAEILQKAIDGYKHVLSISEERLKMSSQNLSLVNKFHERDSVLLSKRVLSPAEIDKTSISLISAQDSYQGMLKDISLTVTQLQQSENQLQQNSIQKAEKGNQLEIQFITALTELEVNIKAWEQKYVFKSPMNGNVQYSKFWVDNQFIQQGEAVFTIVPTNENVVGQMTLPSVGAGKVKVGQEVIVKLDNFPYMEYGSIKGIVSFVSLTPNVALTAEGTTVDSYLINVALPEALKTNYGSKLAFKFESKGTGDIITNERKLIQRLFDNLKYKLNQ